MLSKWQDSVWIKVCFFLIDTACIDLIFLFPVFCCPGGKLLEEELEELQIPLEGGKKPRAESEKTEVPWLAHFLPLKRKDVKYIALLRQPRTKSYVGYYKLRKDAMICPPKGYTQHSRQCVFKEGRKATEHTAAQVCLTWIWTKHRELFGESFPNCVEVFLKKCDVCSSENPGRCTFLQQLENTWKKRPDLQQRQKDLKKKQRQKNSSSSSSSSSSSDSSTDSSSDSSSDS